MWFSPTVALDHVMLSDLFPGAIDEMTTRRASGVATTVGVDSPTVPTFTPVMF